jgi:hypothetical protein
MIVKLASTKSMRVAEKIRVFAFGMFPWASGTRCCCLHISRCWMARGKWDASKDSYRGNSSPVLSGSAHPVNPAVNSFPHWTSISRPNLTPFLVKSPSSPRYTGFVVKGVLTLNRTAGGCGSRSTARNLLGVLSIFIHVTHPQKSSPHHHRHQSDSLDTLLRWFQTP